MRMIFLKPPQKKNVINRQSTGDTHLIPWRIAQKSQLCPLQVLLQLGISSKDWEVIGMLGRHGFPKKTPGLGQLNQSLFKVESFWRVFDTVEKKTFQENYNTPQEHTPGNPLGQLWKESHYSRLVKV